MTFEEWWSLREPLPDELISGDVVTMVARYAWESGHTEGWKAGHAEGYSEGYGDGYIEQGEYD